MDAFTSPEDQFAADNVEMPDYRAQAEARRKRPLTLSGFLNTGHWLERELEPPEPLLGEIITNTTRMFIGGPTGLGKTHLGMAMAAGMASGRGFLHWKASRPCRVLYIDGEMARDLVQERLADLQRRMDGADLSGLFVLCAEDCEYLAERFPTLGKFEPLNTEAGQEFILAVIAMLGRVDAVFFDNRMSLLSGDMKDEVPWAQTMPLVKEITKQRIAQIWLDHTGHNTGQLYGTKTKEWPFDAVALLTKAERPGLDIAFTMEFTKARRRKPSNRADFEPATMAMVGDQWTREDATAATAAACRSLSPQDRTGLGFLNDVLVLEGEPLPPAWGMASDLRCVSLDRWEEECAARSLTRSSDSKNQHDVFNRTFKSLRDKHALVAARDGKVWAT